MHRERWLLPAGIEEILPAQARITERLRRDLLDLYRGWGYQLVIPAFIDWGAEAPAQEFGCGEVLRLRDEGWVLEPA
jgi:ATP phosphoribosyltransferase regulatory subunit HisZ